MDTFEIPIQNADIHEGEKVLGKSRLKTKLGSGGGPVNMLIQIQILVIQIHSYLCRQEVDSGDDTDG